MIDELKRMPMVGDIVEWDNFSYKVFNFEANPDGANIAIILSEPFGYMRQTVLVGNLTVIEYSPLHKLQIMTEELGQVDIEFGHNEGWACEIGFGINLFRAERSTFEEAINAVWAKWKGSA